MPVFDLLRFSLSAPAETPLLEGVDKQKPSMSRQDFLRFIFGGRCEFVHFGKTYVFTPSPTNTDSDPMVSGYIGKEISRDVQSGPENLHAMTTSSSWAASFLVMDTRPAEQVLYFEERTDVGSSKAVLLSLAAERVSQFRGTSWVVDIEHKTRISDFWEAVDKFKGSITQVDFEFVPANGLEGYDMVKNLHKHFTEPSNADQSGISIKNSKGELVPKGDYVEGALQYAAEGVGKTKIKSGRKVIFSSEEGKETKEAPEELMPRDAEQPKILGLISYLFGRSHDK